MHPTNPLAVAAIIIPVVFGLFTPEIRCLILGCPETTNSSSTPTEPIPQDPPGNPVVPQPETSSLPPPKASPVSVRQPQDQEKESFPQGPNRPSSPASEPAREGRDPEEGDRARIVSRNGSNRLAIRGPSCDSTSMRFVNVGLVVTLGKRSPSGDGIPIRAEDGSLLGCIPQEKLELLGPVEE